MRDTQSREVKKLPTLRGKTVVNLFFEDSTRTRISFEAAAKRLSADVINFSAKGSSGQQGRVAQDTAQTLQAMGADAVVIRHGVRRSAHARDQRLDHRRRRQRRRRHPRAPDAGAPRRVHHPQAPLRRRQPWPRPRGMRVAIVGDILHSRVARSNVWLLRRSARRSPSSRRRRWFRRTSRRGRSRRLRPRRGAGAGPTPS
jgi:aspartate carbamoyltransferase catalytic subunit